LNNFGKTFLVKRNLITLLAVSAGIIVASFANDGVLKPLIIKGPYYIPEQGYIFYIRCLYFFKTFAGGHPLPTTFDIPFYTLHRRLVCFFPFKILLQAD